MSPQGFRWGFGMTAPGEQLREQRRPDPGLHRDDITTTTGPLDRLRARAGKGRTVEVALLLVIVAVLAGMAVAVYLLAEADDEDRWDE